MEIKEILSDMLHIICKYGDDFDDLEENEIRYQLPYTKMEKLYDYITNLQQENERLKETNVYCNRTDCVGRIRDSKKYDSVYQEKENYKSRIEKAVEYIKEDMYSEPNELYGLIDGEHLLNILNGRSDE